MSDTITRTFTARFGDEEILLAPKPYQTPHGRSTVWEAQNTDGETIGVLQSGPACDGWRFAHPEDRNTRLTLALGVSVDTLPERVYGVKDAETAGGWDGKSWDSLALVTDVTETTPPCESWDYEILLSSVQSFVRPKYNGGMCPEGEAWQQAVVLPRRMESVLVSVQDLRRALRECGWSLGDPVRGYWYHTGS